MPLPDHWATLEDFATLFQYLWHRDFPLGREVAIGTRRVDWTTHIGFIIRQIANHFGMTCRFEAGGRRDAVLRSNDGDEIAAEWEWDNVRGNELGKLREHKAWSANKKISKKLRFGVLVSYSSTDELENDIKHVSERWVNIDYPLLLVLIEYDMNRKLRTQRQFRSIHFTEFCSSGSTILRQTAAVPWELDSTWFDRV